MSKPHMIERRAAMLVEAMRLRIKKNVEMLKREDGSPIFSTVLTSEEKLQRWQDPQLRQIQEAKAFAQGGQTGLEGYRNEMMREELRHRNEMINNPALGRFGE